jgi:OOP family OmpA-OmpF porin
MGRLAVILLSLLVVAPLDSFSQQKFEKLPLSIDTPDGSELLPVISSDSKTLYFTRTRLGMDNTTVFDIWRSHILNDTTFSPAEFVGGNLASAFGIAVTSIAPDNNTLYLVGKMRSDDPPDARLFVTHKTSDGWSIPEPLRIRNLNARGIYTDYGFGPDQKTLLMAVQRDSSLGGRDLYVSFFTSGIWSTPLWLGPTINSPYSEMTPYLASDNKTLYFSSDRPGGIGSADVYRSTRLDDSWQHWTKPENLGYSVNQPGRTTYYTEDAAGKFAYVSWKLSPSDQSDLYRIRVSHAQAVALLHGVVKDATGKPLLAHIRYERLSDGKELGNARSDPATGEYQLTLPAGEDYAIHAEKEGYFPTSEHIDLRNLTSFKPIERNLALSKIETGAAITLKNVFFETDKATLLPASSPELDRVKDLLTSHPEYKLSIAGHTDNTGSEQHNIELGKDRAEAVKAYLISHGIIAERLTTVSYGSTKPVASNDTEEGRAQNRRVEFVLQ